MRDFSIPDFFLGISPGKSIRVPTVLFKHYDHLRTHYAHPAISLDTESKLVLHDTKRIKWPNPCNRFRQRHGISCTQLANRILNEIINHVLAGIQEHRHRLAALFEFVRDHVQYVPERRVEYLRFPIETLLNRQGDCEDFAMALVALYKLAGYEVALFLFYDDSKAFYHVCCAVRAEKWLSERELWVLTGYQRMGYVWKILDPAFQHEFDTLPAWKTKYLDPRTDTWVPRHAAKARIVDYHSLKPSARLDIKQIRI